MSLACLTCHNVTRTHSDLRSYSFGSQDEERWGSAAIGCWSYNRRHPHHPPPAASASAETTVKTKVVPVTSSSSSSKTTTSSRNPSMNTDSQDSVSPRLTRCHAVRRDIFRDWHFEDFPEGNRLCLT